MKVYDSLVNCISITDDHTRGILESWRSDGRRKGLKISAPGKYGKISTYTREHTYVVLKGRRRGTDRWLPRRSESGHLDLWSSIFQAIWSGAAYNFRRWLRSRARVFFSCLLFIFLTAEIISVRTNATAAYIGILHSWERSGKPRARVYLYIYTWQCGTRGVAGPGRW